jgi:hypothetical protein
MHSPIVVAVGGFASNVGKTAVMCHLINAFPGWEAIKIDLPMYSHETFLQLVAEVRAVSSSVANTTSS